jgi:Zn-dependent peptidase ImmA (M78 family)
VEPIPELGRALAHLRSLRGLSIDECASLARMTPEEVTSAERGAPAQAEALLRALHGLQPEDLRDGFVAPVEHAGEIAGVSGATVFLFHGAYQDFDADDLVALDRAMRGARLLSALPRAEVMSRRLQFAPSPPAGPAAVDAALQGHKFARLVRARLGWGSEPLGDMRELLEAQLGISVFVDELVTTDLRAASIVDEARCAAAAVLSANDPELRENPLLARVYLAHELCHVLFDPSLPGRVRVALDDRLYERVPRDRALPTTALLESRAKAFAAELLMPLEGLTELAGPPGQVASVAGGESLARAARERFGTPWEITIYHLRNRGYLGAAVLPALLRKKVPPLARSHSTSLPAAGAVPTVFEHDAVGEADTVSAHSTRHDPVPARTPEYVAAARKSMRDVQRRNAEGAVARAEQATTQERPLEATDVIVDRLDDLLHASAFEDVGRMLDLMRDRNLPPPVLTGALLATRGAREELGAARERFAAHVEDVLVTRWGHSIERARATICRLR